MICAQDLDDVIRNQLLRAIQPAQIIFLISHSTQGETLNAHLTQWHCISKEWNIDQICDTYQFDVWIVVLSLQWFYLSHAPWILEFLKDWSLAFDFSFKDGIPKCRRKRMQMLEPRAIKQNCWRNPWVRQHLQDGGRGEELSKGTISVLLQQFDN